MTSHYLRRNRKALSHKPRGRTGSGNRKLDDSQRAYMRELYATGRYRMSELARMFEVSQSTVQKVTANEGA